MNNRKKVLALVEAMLQGKQIQYQYHGVEWKDCHLSGIDMSELVDTPDVFRVKPEEFTVWFTVVGGQVTGSSIKGPYNTNGSIKKLTFTLDDLEPVEQSDE